MYSSNNPIKLMEALKRDLSSFKTERSPYESEWKQIQTYVYPWTYKTESRGNNNPKSRDDTRIYDSSTLRAADILASGMHGGMTNPSSKWFRLTPNDKRLREDSLFRSWISEVEDIMYAALHKSNFYTEVPKVFKGMGTNGIDSIIVSEDTRNGGVRFYQIPAGQFYVGLDDNLIPNRYFREFEMTCSQIVQKFGEENCSQNVISGYRNNNDAYIKMIHAIVPNDDYYPRLTDPLTDDDVYTFDISRYKFLSCYFEVGEDKFLDISGDYEFPAMTPRWDFSSGEVYGRGPGKYILQEARALQKIYLQELRIIDKITNPPMAAPSGIMGNAVNMAPGGLTLYNPAQGAPYIQPIYTPNVNSITIFGNKKIELIQHINSAFFVDLFLMFASNGPDSNMTATEVLQRQQEKMTVLGPVLVGVINDLLDPLIRRVYEILKRQDAIPPLPDEFNGQEFNIEYVSILAQAQKQAETSPILNLLGIIGDIASIYPDAPDNVDFDKAIFSFADAIGVKQDILRSNDDIAIIRQQREEALQRQQQLEYGTQLANAGLTLSKTNTGGNNALTNLAEGANAQGLF